ncbi:MAG: DUF3046 domain-containing protein [Micrococcales bacterium]|nr:DUF3046 domain-containing protein [Micrococcales bacterium]
MKVSEFRRAVVEEFGSGYSAVLTRDTHLAELDGRTADEALAAGVPAGTVWLALCRFQDVPESRRHGRGLPEPQR